MRCVSFNINGLRAHFQQLEIILTRLQPDIVALQETKIEDNIFPKLQIMNLGYHHIYQNGQKNHYGVAVICRHKPLTIKYNLIYNENATQKRIMAVDFLTSKGKLTIINGYFPQGKNRNDLIKFSEKCQFYQNLQNFVISNFHKNEPLIIMGDMNISPDDLDIGVGEKNKKKWIMSGKCSFLPEERQWINNLLDWGMTDVYRYLYPKIKHHYSWFDYRLRSFHKNIGLRIDLILVSNILIPTIKDSGINYEIRTMEKPSDHAPIWADFYL